jgi:hypothetical protein
VTVAPLNGFATFVLGAEIPLSNLVEATIEVE